MRLVILLLFSAPVLAYVWFAMQENFVAFAMASFLSALFVTQDIFSVYNNARLASRLNTLANAIGMLLSFTVSFLIAWFKFSPLWLTFSIVSVTLIPYLIKRYMFYQSHSDNSPPKHKNKDYLRYLLFAGMPLAISSIFISIQVKVAQLFLVSVGSAQDLGLLLRQIQFRLRGYLFPSRSLHPALLKFSESVRMQRSG